MKTMFMFIVLALLVVGCGGTTSSDSRPVLSDSDFIMETEACIPLMNWIGEDALGCGAWAVSAQRRLAALTDCWNGLPNPADPDLISADTSIEQALVLYRLSMDEFENACAGSGDLTVATKLMASGTELMHSATQHIQNYSQKSR